MYVLVFLFLMIRRPPRSTLFPYTTLFRSGRANPTLAITFRIANAFGLSIGELVESTASNPNIEVVHGSDPNNLFRADDECRIRTLSPLHMEKNVEFYELIIEPKASLTSTAHFEGTQELLTVTSGTAEVEIGRAPWRESV